MCSAYRKKHRHIIKVISTMTLLIFTCSFVLPDAWAALDTSNNGNGAKRVNIDTFSMPVDLGMVRYVHKGNSDKVLIHIQDAHCNYPAQKKVAEIIEYVNSEYGIKDVNLEGGAGAYDLSVFTDIYDKGVREKVADYFVQWGRVNGAEFFALNNPDKVTLWGVEEPDLYMENLDVYRNSLAYKEEALEYISLLDHYLTNLKKHMYSPELLEIDTKYGEYKSNTIEFKDYLLFLIAKAKMQGMNIKDHPNIYLLSQSMEQEDKIDFKKANKERDALIERLQGVLSKSEIKELLVKTVAFRNKVIPQSDFYEYLITKAKASNLEMEQFPELRKFIIYISLYNAVDKTIIMKEVETLEADIKNMLFQNEKQRELDKFSKNLVLTKNIFEVAFTREDYRYYKENKDSFNVEGFVSFIKREAPAYRISVKLPADIDRLNGFRDEMFNFFEISFKRDDAFINNLKFSGEEVKTGVLVTGGFHTDNMCELLRKNGISYISIIPSFRMKEGYECPYFSILAGGVSPVEAAIDSVALSLIQVASMLNELGVEVEGAEKAEIFDLGVAAITAFVEGDGKPIGMQFEGTTGAMVIRMNPDTGLPQLSMVTGTDIVDTITIQNFNESFRADPEGAKAAMKALFSEVAQDSVIARAINNNEDQLLLDGNAGIVQTQQLVDSLQQPVVGEMWANTDKRLIPGLTLPHAGGRGIYMPANLPDTEQPYIIVHELIAGIYEGDATRDSHQLARAVENALRDGDAEAARTLLANATRHTTDREGEGKVERTIWEMTQAERWGIPRDYAAGAYDLDRQGGMSNRAIEYYNSRQKKTRVQAYKGARAVAADSDVPDVIKYFGLIVEAASFFAIYSALNLATVFSAFKAEPAFMMMMSALPAGLALVVSVGHQAKKEGEIFGSIARGVSEWIYGKMNPDFFMDPALDPVDAASNSLRKIVGKNIVRELNDVIPGTVAEEKARAKQIVKSIAANGVDKATVDRLKEFMSDLEGTTWYDLVVGGVADFLALQDAMAGVGKKMSDEKDVARALSIVSSLQGTVAEEQYSGLLGNDQGLRKLAGFFAEQFGTAMALSMLLNTVKGLRAVAGENQNTAANLMKAFADLYVSVAEGVADKAEMQKEVRADFGKEATVQNELKTVYLSKPGSAWSGRFGVETKEDLSFEGMPSTREALVTDAASFITDNVGEGIEKSDVAIIAQKFASENEDIQMNAADKYINDLLPIQRAAATLLVQDEATGETRLKDEAKLRKALSGKGVTEQYTQDYIIKTVEDALADPFDATKGFGFFFSYVEYSEKYNVGNKGAFALDMVRHLNALDAAGVEGVSDRLQEYLLHESLEKIARLEHGGQIIGITSSVFDRGTYRTPGDTPLGKAIRSFIDEQSAARFNERFSRLVSLFNGQPAFVSELTDIQEVFGGKTDRNYKDLAKKADDLQKAFTNKEDNDKDFPTIVKRVQSWRETVNRDRTFNTAESKAAHDNLMRLWAERELYEWDTYVRRVANDLKRVTGDERSPEELLVQDYLLKLGADAGIEQTAELLVILDRVSAALLKRGGAEAGKEALLFEVEAKSGLNFETAGAPVSGEEAAEMLRKSVDFLDVFDPETENVTQWMDVISGFSEQDMLDDIPVLQKALEADTTGRVRQNYVRVFGQGPEQGAKYMRLLKNVGGEPELMSYRWDGQMKYSKTSGAQIPSGEDWTPLKEGSNFSLGGGVMARVLADGQLELYQPERKEKAGILKTRVIPEKVLSREYFGDRQVKVYHTMRDFLDLEGKPMWLRMAKQKMGEVDGLLMEMQDGSYAMVVNATPDTAGEARLRSMGDTVENFAVRIHQSQQPAQMAVSLIGTLRDENGVLYTRGVKILDRRGVYPVTFIPGDGNIPVIGLPSFSVEKALDENGEVVERNAADIFASMEEMLSRNQRSTIVDTEVLRLRNLFENMNVTRVVALEDDERVKGAIDSIGGIMYLNKNLIDNPLAILHELGEGNISTPVGFEAITRHTFMRGVGKDVRDAHISLVRKNGSDYVDTLSVDEYVEALKGEMVAGGKPREMTASEIELIRYNGLQERQDPGIGKEILLYGLQDHLDPDRNMALTLQIRGIRDDFKGGAVNFHVIRNSNLDTRSAQAKHAQSFSRTVRRKEGLEQRVFNFNGTAPLGGALKSALDRAMVVINEQNLGVKGREGAFPKVSVACQTDQDIKDIDKFFADNPDYASYEGLVVRVNDDMGEEDLSGVMIDQGKLIAVGDILCNNKRIMNDYPDMSMSDKTAIFKKDLLLFRALGFFEGADIADIEFEAMSQSDIVDVMNNLFAGVYSMRITRVNWEEIQDWNDAQQEVMRAL